MLVAVNTDGYSTMKKNIIVLLGSLLGLNMGSSLSEASSSFNQFDDIQKLQVLAKIILREEYDTFDKYLNDLKNLDSPQISYDGESYQNPYSAEASDSIYGFELLFLFKTYYETSHIEMIDWKGEEDEGQFVMY